MSPVAKIHFHNVLINSSNLKTWNCEYISVPENIFEPSHGYLENDENKIRDFCRELISKESEIYKIALRTFNKILFNLLQKSVDSYNQDIVDEFHELKNTEEHAAKKIIRKLTDMYGIMKLKDGVKILERYMESCGKKDNFVNSLDISKMSTIKIFLAALYVNSLYGEVRSKILEKYKNRTDIDMDGLKMDVNEHMRDIEKNSSYVSKLCVKSVKGNNGIKCYYCKEKGHKLAECLKLKRKYPNAKFKIDNKIGNLAKSQESFKGLVALTGVSSGFEKHKNKWFIDSGCTNNMYASIDGYKNLAIGYALFNYGHPPSLYSFSLQ